MVIHQGNSDYSFIEGIDFRAFWEVLKLRWWVIPTILLLSVVLLVIRQPDVSSEPGLYTLTETYETVEPYSLLATVGIDTTYIRGLYSTEAIQKQMESDSVKSEIAQRIESDVGVQLKGISFNNGVTIYTFRCIETVRAECPAAIPAYAAKAVELMRETMLKGLSDLQFFFTRLNEKLNSEQFTSKIESIQIIKGEIKSQPSKISSTEEVIEPTRVIQRQVSPQGITAAVLISLLVLLQLTYTDGRIRTRRQLSRIVGTNSVLGHIKMKSDVLSERRAAIGIHTALNGTTVATVRYVPLRRPVIFEDQLRELAISAGAAPHFALPFFELSVAALTELADSEVDVIVVQRNQDLRRDLIQAFATLEHSGRRLAGVLLLD